MKKLKSIINVGEEYSLDQGFSTFTNAVYKHGRLASFVGDGVTYTLAYENGSGLLKSITGDGKTYNFTYINGCLRGFSEEDGE